MAEVLAPKLSRFFSHIVAGGLFFLELVLC